MFSNFQEGFRWHILNCIFAHDTSHTKPSLNLPYQNLHMFIKKGGGWVCGSEQAPLNTTSHGHTITIAPEQNTDG